MNVHIVTLNRDEMADLLGLDTDAGIDRVEVAFSPMMQEWSLIVDLRDEDDSSTFQEGDPPIGR